MNVFEVSVLSLPLIIVLLSLALMPLIAPRFWERNETGFFAILSVVSLLLSAGFIKDSGELLKEALIKDYLPFIIMLFTLYVLSSGIHIRVTCPSDTFSNLIFLGGGCMLSSVIGTTGASMLFLSPFLEMNKERKHKSHLIIFFIFLVSNIGGLLTPLGDPPLLLGYLHGVEFTWELKNILPYWFCYIGVCLTILYLVDSYYLRRESKPLAAAPKFSVEIRGWSNISLILLTVLVLFFDFKGMTGSSSMILKNSLLLFFCALSLFKGRQGGKFAIDLSPFGNVAKTFLVIFIVIAPVIHILNENSESIQRCIADLSNGNNGTMVYFWFCSLASSFLDNAPSYLLFFNMAGGNPNDLMYIHSDILKAISISSVVMGSMTYIGNAPNMMVKSIADKRGIKMPSFLGYMLWSVSIILPVSLVISLILSN